MIRVNDKVVKIGRPCAVIAVGEDGICAFDQFRDTDGQNSCAAQYRRIRHRVLTFNIEDMMLADAQDREELAQIKMATDSVPKVKCGRCGGLGRVSIVDENGIDTGDICEDCHGTGKVEADINEGEKFYLPTGTAMDDLTAEETAEERMRGQ